MYIIQKCLRCLLGPLHVYRNKFQEKTSNTGNCLIQLGLKPMQLTVVVEVVVVYSHESYFFFFFFLKVGGI